MPDAAAIAAVHVRTWQAAYAGLMPNDVLNAMSVSQYQAGCQAKLTSENVGPDATFVAIRDDQIVGFADAGRTRDNDAPGSTGEINAIGAVAFVEVGHCDLSLGRGVKWPPRVG